MTDLLVALAFLAKHRELLILLPNVVHVAIFQRIEFLHFCKDWAIIPLSFLLIVMIEPRHDLAGLGNNLAKERFAGCSRFAAHPAQIRQLPLIEAGYRDHLVHRHPANKLPVPVAKGKPFIHQWCAAPIGDKSCNTINLLILSKLAGNAHKRRFLPSEKLTSFIIDPLHGGVQLPKIMNSRPGILCKRILQTSAVFSCAELTIRAQPQEAIGR